MHKKSDMMFIEDEELIGRKQRSSDEKGKNWQNQTIQQGIDEYFESDRKQR
ncbi:hypothetical protein ACWJJH_06935 [Endozoicomonadaceae bacterium StTr2]